jgi:hypothetical protein
MYSWCIYQPQQSGGPQALLSATRVRCILELFSHLCADDFGAKYHELAIKRAAGCALHGMLSWTIFLSFAPCQSLFQCTHAYVFVPTSKHNVSIPISLAEPETK